MGTMFDYRTIVVGTDGSPLATPTVSRAAWLAAHNDADLVIVCAYAELSRRHEARSVTSLGDARVGQVPGRGAASAAIAAAVALAQEQRATISAALLVDGEPATALLTTAKERAADLVVVGALRDTGIADRLLGSVATEVVRRAECEVLVVRPRHEAAEHQPPQPPASA
jgi:nucleotide-binding universal stress UspA family protein